MILGINFSCFANIPDSLYVSSKEYQTLNERIIKAEKNYIELANETMNIDKLYDKRFNDAQFYTQLQQCQLLYWR